jgi:DNA-binding response OmpR family regulator
MGPGVAHVQRILILMGGTTIASQPASTEAPLPEGIYARKRITGDTECSRLDVAAQAHLVIADTTVGDAVRVLIVEGDEALGEELRDHVAAAGHAIDWFKRLADAGAATETTGYDIVLLELLLPDGDGLTLLQALRARHTGTPVIILTPHDRVSDRIDSLNAGADDCLCKPFDLGELTARMLAVTRRYAGNLRSLVQLPGIVIDQTVRRLVVDGRCLMLSAREWAVLDKLVVRPGCLVSKGQILDALYAFGSEIESNTVEVYISRLRKKIGHDRIETVRGVGYFIK